MTDPNQPKHSTAPPRSGDPLLPIPASRLLPVPAEPPARGQSDDAGPSANPGAYRLGHSLDTGEPVALGVDERKKHFYVCGSSGTGKSYFMLNMILKDIAGGDCGVALLDPHGSLYQLVVHFLAHEAPELAERVVLFDPNSTDYVTGFNPLGDYARSSPGFAVNLMTAACLKGWNQPSPDQTPRIARWLPNLFMPIVANGLTLVETAWLLNTKRDNPYRRLLLKAVKDKFILDDWLDFEEASATQRSQLFEGVQNRLRKFLSNDFVRKIFGQKENALSIERIMAENKVLLVNLKPSEQIDEETMKLIGILLLSEFRRVAQLRQAEPLGRPDPFFLYVDECYSFVTRDIARSLDGTRKYGLFLRLVSQTLKQLKDEDEQLLDSVLTNCHGKVVFGGVNPDDADQLVRQLYTDPEMTLEVKCEHEQIKFRPVEVPNVSYTVTEGKQESSSRTETTGTGHAVSSGEARATSRQTTTGRSDGITHQTGNSETTGEGLAVARGRGTNESASVTKGTSTGENIQEGESVSIGSSDSRGDSDNRQYSRGEQVSGLPGALPSRSTSASVGSGHNTTHSDNRSQTHNRSVGHQHTEQESASSSAGKSSSETVTVSGNKSQSDSETNGTQHSVSSSESQGQTDTASHTVTDSEQHSVAKGTSSGKNQGCSVSIGVRHRMEEFTEVTPQYWSLADVRNRQACRLMDQGKAVATIRIANGPVQHTRIEHLELPPIDPQYTPQHWQLFREDVIDGAPEYYLTPEEALRAVEARQRRIFEGVLDEGEDRRGAGRGDRGGRGAPPPDRPARRSPRPAAPRQRRDGGTADPTGDDPPTDGSPSPFNR